MIVALWYILPIIVGLPIGAYMYEIALRTIKYFFRVKRAKLLAVVIVALMAVACYLFGVWAIVLLHFTAFCLLCDLAALIIRKVHKAMKAAKAKKENGGETEIALPETEGTRAAQTDGIAASEISGNNENGRSEKRVATTEIWAKRVYYSRTVAVLLTAAIMTYGVVNMRNVVRTDYTVYTDKVIREEGYTVVLAADLHFGTATDEEALSEIVAEINGIVPDLVILAGDIVDGNTKKGEARTAFRTLGGLKSRFGTYYVYGNHDLDGCEEGGDFTAETLRAEIETAGIVILEDSVEEINGELTLCGRADRSYEAVSDRATAEELAENSDPSSFRIMIDHQPCEYAAVRDAGFDMILSGHTHAGQIWPAGALFSLLSLNEQTYGRENYGQMTAIVTSGLAGWGYPVRTEKHSEYVVISLSKRSA